MGCLFSKCCRGGDDEGGGGLVEGRTFKENSADEDTTLRRGKYLNDDRLLGDCCTLILTVNNNHYGGDANDKTSRTSIANENVDFADTIDGGGDVARQMPFRDPMHHHQRPQEVDEEEIPMEELPLPRRKETASAAAALASPPPDQKKSTASTVTATTDVFYEDPQKKNEGCTCSEEEEESEDLIQSQQGERERNASQVHYEVDDTMNFSYQHRICPIFKSSSSSSSSSDDLEQSLSACRSCQRPPSDSLRVESGSRAQSLLGGGESKENSFDVIFFLF